MILKEYVVWNKNCGTMKMEMTPRTNLISVTPYINYENYLLSINITKIFN